MPVTAILIIPEIEKYFDNPTDAVGFIPDMLDWGDPRPAREQIDANYAHGGGWHPQDGFRMLGRYVIQYPGDPPLSPLAFMKLREETIVVYLSGFTAIFQDDDSFEVARLD